MSFFGKYDPKYVADLRSEDSSRELAKRWGISKSTVNNHREALRTANLETPETEHLRTSEQSSDGSFSTEWIRTRAATLKDAEQWVTDAGYNPEDYNISVRTIAYGEGMWSNKMTAVPKHGSKQAIPTTPLAQLYKEVEKTVKPQRVGKTEQLRATVVVLADWQLGKTARRGGTKETLERLRATRDLLEKVYSTRNPREIILLDAGDGIEGFESGGDPDFTNDLSLPDQLDCYATEMFKFVRQADSHTSRVTVAAVPSNHAKWRKGKQNLGKPTDDFGLFVHKQVQKVAEAAGLESTWVYPEEYDESVLVEVMGVPVGMVHGSQFAPGRAVEWWQGQTFGGQSITKADVMVHGHYHSFSAGVAGINPFTGRERYFLGAPTVDPGSDWYRNIKGRDSLPGTLVFDVTETGFDLGSLTII